MPHQLRKLVNLASLLQVHASKGVPESVRGNAYLTQLSQGELHVVLFGQKLRGAFAFIRQPRFGEKAWLLIKERDRYASDVDITLQDRSVLSGKRLGEGKE